MTFVMRILVMHANGHLAQPFNLQSALSALDHCLPIAAGKSWGSWHNGQSLYWDYWVFFQVAYRPFRARNSRVVLLSDTYCMQWRPRHLLLSTYCTVNTRSVDVLSISAMIIFLLVTTHDSTLYQYLEWSPKTD